MAHDMQDTKKRVVEIVAEKLSIDPSGITETVTLQDLGADSLDMVEIIMKLEEEFDISIDDEKAESFDNLGQVIAYIHSLRI